MAYFGYFIVKNGYLSLLQHVHIYIYHLIHTFLTFYLQRSFDSPLIPPFSDGIPPTRPAVSSSTGAVSSAVVPPTGAARAAGGCARLGHVMSRRGANGPCNRLVFWMKGRSPFRDGRLDTQLQVEQGSMKKVLCLPSLG